jgi:hypothetical protein
VCHSVFAAKFATTAHSQIFDRACVEYLKASLATNTDLIAYARKAGMEVDTENWH